jgi:hypothetical protein
MTPFGIGREEIKGYFPIFDRQLWLYEAFFSFSLSRKASRI